MGFMWYFLLTVSIVFTLWLGYRILEKSGFDGRLVLLLLVPALNIIMLWVYAFKKWPNLKSGVEQDIN
jgi:hypothetical protein